MAQMTTQHIGPNVVLPNQHIAIVPQSGSVIYILDTKIFRASTFGYRIHEGLPRGGGTLFYSIGHLVLVTIGRTYQSFYVWKVGENNQGSICSITFLYRRSESWADIVVAGNGKIYMLQQTRLRANAGTSEQIQVFDVASGHLLNTIELEVQNNNPPFVGCSLLLSENHLLLIRRRPPLGTLESFDNAGLGVRAFALVENDLVETSFLPAFQDGSVSLDMETSNQANNLILYRSTEALQFIRMISINRDGILHQEADGINIGTRRQVKHNTPAKRVFVENKNGADDIIIKLCEYDLATSTKVRTIATSLPRERYSIHSVLSTEQAVVCIFLNRHDGDHVIQIFAL